MDLDAKQLHSVVGDEGRIIPKKIQKALIAALSDDPGQFTMPSYFILWVLALMLNNNNKWQIMGEDINLQVDWLWGYVPRDTVTSTDEPGELLQRFFHDDTTLRY